MRSGYDLAATRYDVGVDEPLVGGQVLVEELEGQVQHLVGELGGLEVAELGAEGRERNARLGHRAVTTGAADVVEILPHELAGVLRVTEVPYRHHDRFVDDA